MQISKNIIVKGFVQGVSFRKQTKRVATTLGVNGWVRNLDNGNVEACLEGDEKAVDDLISWCAFGPKKAKVDEVQVIYHQFKTSSSDFRILEDRKIGIQ